MPKPCHGNCADHCCYFRGVICPYVEEDTVPGRRWTCGLLRELGTWDAVLEDERYRTIVQDLYNTVPELEGTNCRDWYCKDLMNGDSD